MVYFCNKQRGLFITWTRYIILNISWFAIKSIFWGIFIQWFFSNHFQYRKPNLNCMQLILHFFFLFSMTHYLGMSILLSPTSSKYWLLKHVEDYVRGCIWQLKKIKTIYRFHILVFDRDDSNLECFNRATHYYRLWRPSPVKSG